MGFIGFRVCLCVWYMDIDSIYTSMLYIVVLFMLTLYLLCIYQIYTYSTHYPLYYTYIHTCIHTNYYYCYCYWYYYYHYCYYYHSLIPQLLTTSSLYRQPLHQLRVWLHRYGQCLMGSAARTQTTMVSYYHYYCRCRYC